MKLHVVFLSLAVLAASASAAPSTPSTSAPSAPPPPTSFHELEVSITGVDDNPRAKPATYTIVLEENQRGTVQSGQNISLGVGSGGAVVRHSLGLDISLSYRLRGSVIVLEGNIELSSVDPATATKPTPVFRRVRAASTVAIVPGTPARFTSLYDLNTKQRVEVTVMAKRVM